MPTALRAATIAVSLSALAAFAAPALAAATAAPVKGNAEAGATKAATCMACHGPNGNGSINPEWPALAGQGAGYIAEQVAAVKDGKRMVAQMMPIVQGLSAQDMADIGVYFARQTPVGREADAANWAAGEKLYRNGDSARGIPACMACHGPAGKGNPAANYPALRAQHAVYSLKQLNDYASDARYTKDAKGKSQGNANAQMMQTIAGRLTADERRNLASYIQGMR
jgi:cytochrome c553